MPWTNEQRYPRAKVVQHTENPNRRRISATVGRLHYESSLDSGNFDAEVDMSPQRVNNNLLNGWRVQGSSWHFAYQGFPATGNQPAQGTLAYGGRKGENWFLMRPARVGYLHIPTLTFDAIGGAPTFSTPSLQTRAKTIGINDDDPSVWTLNASFEASMGALWTTPNGAAVNWIIKGSGGGVKQDFVIEEQARNWIANNRPPLTPAGQTAFGVAYRIDRTDIPRLLNDGVEIGDDNDVGDNLVMETLAGRRLGRFQRGEIYVPGRGGHVQVRKRVYFDGLNWWLFIGALVSEMQQNLLAGDLVIDPPIGEESVSANDDDAWQYGNTVYSQTANMVYIGGNANYHTGFRFQTVPIDQGATVNSATLEPMQNTTDGSEACTVYGIDEDNVAAFALTASEITNETRTTASTGLTGTDWQGNGNRTNIDVQSQVQEIVDRAGWASDNAMGFVMISTSTTYTFIGWDAYEGGATNACDFNADVESAGGTANPKGVLGGVVLGGPFGGPTG